MTQPINQSQILKQRKAPSAGGGFHALAYTLRLARRVGPLRLWRAMTARNACKTCALGMGGQQGGMRNELGHWPEVCKKSLQAMAADMQGELAPEFFQKFSARQMQAMSPRELETAGRITTPLVLGPGATHYRAISWDDALQRVSTKLAATSPKETFFYFSGRSSNEAAFLLQLFARIYGTNHVNNCSYYCHQASGVGLGQAIGVGTATVTLEDVEHCDTLFLIGGNPASNHPRLMTQLMRLRRRGGRVVVVNPARETGLVRFRVPSDPWSLFFGTAMATHYLQVHIGGDVALMMGIAKALSVSGSIEEAFLARATDGSAEAMAVAAGAEWSDLERASGVTRVEMEEAASVYARSKRTIFSWTMGITHHEHGVENVQWITNLALMRAMIGRPGAGLLPLRGHSNVQGLGTIGITPTLRDKAARRFADLGIPLPDHKGLDTAGCVAAAHGGTMRVGWALGGNLYGASPDAAHAHAAISRLDQMVYLSTSLNTGHAHGLAKETIILPVLARDEEPYKTTQESMFSFVRVSDGGAARHVGPRGEVDVIAAVARAVLGNGSGAVDWRALAQASAIRALIAKLVPGMEAAAGIDSGAVDRRGKGREFQIPGRALAFESFPTPSGRARLFAHPLPQRAPFAPSELMMMTVRSEGQFNTVVYEDDDFYRGQERRDVILMAPADIARLGLTVGDRVTIRNATGTMRGILVRPFDVRAGNAMMYCPEANVLVPRTHDPQSLTPAFKAVRIIIERELVPRPTGVSGHGKVPHPVLQMLRRWRRPKLNAC